MPVAGHSVRAGEYEQPAETGGRRAPRPIEQGGYGLRRVEPGQPCALVPQRAYQSVARVPAMGAAWVPRRAIGRLLPGRMRHAEANPSFTDVGTSGQLSCEPLSCAPGGRHGGAARRRMELVARVHHAINLSAT